MRKPCVTLLVISLLILSGCSFFDQHVELSPIDVKKPGSIIGDVLDPKYNPYNYTTESDEEYVFYSDAKGIHKWPIKGGKTLLVLSEEKVRGIALHGAYIYYIKLGLETTVYRIDKDGTNKVPLKTNLEDQRMFIEFIFCLQDTLYICSNLVDDPKKGLVYFLSHIAFDQDELEFFDAPGIPTSRGAYYSAIAEPSSPDAETAPYTLYLISADDNNRELIAGEIWGEPKYLITDNYVFYIRGMSEHSALWRCDLYGQNHVEMIGGNKIYLILNYDDDWIYGYAQQGIVCRINQETGEVEEYPNWPFRSIHPYFNLVGEYLYGFDSEPVSLNDFRMNIGTGKVECATYH